MEGSARYKGAGEEDEEGWRGGGSGVVILEGIC